ncbi:hypothetical protein [Polyangium aurulentum]|uniref:hypothetical protein n=1 Tax=Polyangium aurulentum TaxID=2567896 RepID=UPI00146A6FAF|nr:hypothetical protein [Polyangium aurulentum]UQA58379.1 hypothetical protein E8A73_045235 [Polyangium aurulentum]
MSRTSCNTRSAGLDRHRGSRAGRLAAASALVILAMASCARRDEEAPKAAPSASVSAAPRATATQGSGERGSGAEAEPQPDFIKYPPVHMKPPCESSSESAVKDGGHRCVTLTLRCPELDPGESVWLATTPPVAKVRLPESAKGLRVTDEDAVSATVCCKPASAEQRAVKAQIKLFTNEVAGAVHAIECP